ncbi:hypothetical protein MGMO_45c00010 [Methyloglobulus morosus KoM1]|uniref:Uncharacterized protein n=1 Tax=Methyloglobulus morosus KoM1 TaxID=1116472 RepID=V5BY51_9GAMM|nr:hypothetical protein MGMO_45c00010 [Methyloglobulus morosus KoM1]
MSGRVKFLPLAWAGMPKTSFRKNSDSPKAQAERQGVDTVRGEPVKRSHEQAEGHEPNQRVQGFLNNKETEFNENNPTGIQALKSGESLTVQEKVQKQIHKRRPVHGLLSSPNPLPSREGNLSPL